MTPNRDRLRELAARWNEFAINEALNARVMGAHRAAPGIAAMFQVAASLRALADAPDTNIVGEK